MKGLLGRALGCALALLVAVAVLPAVARALEPPRPGELDKYSRDGSLATREAFATKLGNDKVAPQLVQNLQSRLRAQVLGLNAPNMAPPLAWGGMPTIGTDKILVLCIDFSDYPATTPTATIADKVFGAGDSTQYPYESLHNYYQRSSYNLLDLQGSVLGWYRPAYTRACMAMTGASRENLIKEALQYYDGSVDYSQFDNNHDGKIDYFAVLWTGPDNGWANFWWGYQTSWYYTTSPSFDGVTPKTYSWQWERPWSNGVPSGAFTPRVMIHETGHALGLPDYYDYKSKAQGDTVGPDGGIGGYDIMDANTGDHNAFSKWLLDWIAPPVVSWVTRTQTLSPSCTNRTGSSLVVMPGLAVGNWNAEFFLVQNRNLTWDSNDRNMPGSGLQIWHVDARLDGLGYDYLFNNSYTSHKLLRLQEADGLEEIEQNKYMNAGDYYTAGTQIGPSGTPNTRRYDGTDTGIVVDTISELGRDVTFRVVGGPDHTAPVTISGGADSLWHNQPVALGFSGSDMVGGSGMLRTEYNVDGTGWVTGTSYTVPAPADHSGDGVHTVQYRSVDNAENTEVANQVQVKIDTQAPVTTVGGSDALWHNSDVSLSFNAVDAGGSGLARTQYNVDGTGWVTGTSLLYAALPDHSHDGAHGIVYTAIDNAGNLASGWCSVMIDTAGPVTSDGSGGVWHRTPYTVAVTATDANSGVGAVYVGARGSAPKERSTVTFRARRHNLGGGVFPISYFALDSIGNSGDSHVGYVRIDDEMPTTTINFTSGAVVYGSFTVVLTPHDKFSGVASPADVHFRTRLNGGTWNAWTTGTSGTIPAPPTGEYAGDVEYYSVDRAGNVGLTQSASLTILPARLVAGLYYPPPAR